MGWTKPLRDAISRRVSVHLPDHVQWIHIASSPTYKEPAGFSFRPRNSRLECYGSSRDFGSAKGHLLRGEFGHGSLHCSSSCCAYDRLLQQVGEQGLTSPPFNYVSTSSANSAAPSAQSGRQSQGVYAGVLPDGNTDGAVVRRA